MPRFSKDSPSKQRRSYNNAELSSKQIWDWRPYDHFFSLLLSVVSQCVLGVHLYM